MEFSKLILKYSQNSKEPRIDHIDLNSEIDYCLPAIKIYYKEVVFLEEWYKYRDKQIN